MAAANATVKAQKQRLTVVALEMNVHRSNDVRWYDDHDHGRTFANSRPKVAEACDRSIIQIVCMHATITNRTLAPAFDR